MTEEHRERHEFLRSPVVVLFFRDRRLMYVLKSLLVHLVKIPASRIKVYLLDDIYPDCSSRPFPEVLNSFSTKIARAGEVFCDQPILVISDLVTNYTGLSIRNTDDVCEAVISSLIMENPAISWAFVGDKLKLSGIPRANRLSFTENGIYSADTFASELQCLKDIIHFAGSEYGSLLDFSGLRCAVRLRSGGGSLNADGLTRYVCCAIDDEMQHASFAAYIAFRNGYSALTLTSLSSMDKVCHVDDADDSSFFGGVLPDLIFEDLYLGFIDRPGHLSFEELNKKRKQDWPWLDQVDKRLVLTYGKGVGACHYSDNVSYLRKQAGNRLRGLIIKPISGVYDLKKMSRVRPYGKNSSKRAWRKVWRTVTVPASPENEKPEGHSAPGRILFVALELIKNARAGLEPGCCYFKALNSAVMAEEAIRLLQSQTPTASLEALAVLHKAECILECSSYGVAQDFHVEERIRDLRAAIKTVGTHFDDKHRKACRLDAEVSILNELVGVFRAYGQFDEELAILSRSRQASFELTVQRKSKGFIWRVFGGPANRYLNFCLSGGVPRILAMTLLWMVLSGALVFGVALLVNDFGPQVRLNFFDECVRFVTYYVTMEMPSSWENYSSHFQLVMACIGVVSILHFGLFLAHLYNLISRR